MSDQYMFLVVFSITLFMCKGSEFVVRAVRGEAVHMPCLLHQKSNLLGAVEWTKNGAEKTIICNYKVNLNKASTQDCISRFTFTIETLKLHIENVQHSDFGSYSCRRLRLVPPPVLDEITNVTLLVEELSLRYQKNINETCIQLLCILETVNPKQVNFTWNREGQTLPHLSTSSTSSELNLCKPDWVDEDTISCQASYFFNNKLYIMKKTVSQFSDESFIRKHLIIRDVICNIFLTVIALTWIIFCVYKCKRLFSD